MNINKQLSSLGLLSNFILLLSFCILPSCQQTYETSQPQVTETIEANKTEISRLTQIQPLSKEIIQDTSVFYKCDLQRTGVFKGENPKLKGEAVWRFETANEKTDPKYIGERSSPIIFEDIVYVGNVDNNIYSVDANTGDRLWNFQTNGPITASPALWNRTLYVGSYDGFFYAINIDSQKLRWKYKTDGPIYSSPAIAEKMVFFGSTDGTFYALDGLTGEVKWQFQCKGKTCNRSPAILGNRIYFVMNESRGIESEWLRMNSFSSSFPTDDKEILTQDKLIDNYCTLYVHNLKSGKEEWSVCIDGYDVSAPCIYDNNLYMGYKQRVNITDLKYTTHFKNGLISIDINENSPSFKSMQWVLNDKTECTELAVSDKVLCAGKGCIDGYNPQTGQLMWEYVVDRQLDFTAFNLIMTPPAFNGHGDLVYFGDSYGSIYAIKAETGEIALLFQVPKEDKPYETINMFVVSFPVLYKNKMYIYVSKEVWNTEDLGDRKQIGVLYCLK